MKDKKTFRGLSEGSSKPVRHAGSMRDLSGWKPELRKFGFLVAMVCAIGLGHVVAAHPDAAQSTLFGSIVLPVMGGLAFDPKKMEGANGEFNGQALADYLVNLRAEINAMLKGLGPLEQFEASAELSFGLRSLQRTAAELIETSENLQQATSAFVQKITAKAGEDAKASAEAALLATGNYVLKTDAETARDAAVDAAKGEVRQAITAEAEAVTKITAARAKLVSDKILTETVAAALPDTFFAAEGYEDRLTKLNARLATLKDKKLAGAEAFAAEMVAISLDEAGDKIFNARVKSVEGLVAGNASRATGAGTGLVLAAGAAESGLGGALIF